MKKRRCDLAILGMLCLIGLGYYIPIGTMRLEDKNLRTERKTIEIEDISLNMQKENIIEKLGIFNEMLMNDFVIMVDEKIMIASETKQANDETNEKKANMLQQYLSDFWENLDLKEDLKYETFQATRYAMMVSPRDKRVFSVWQCKGINEGNDPYCFWVDDATGKVMAFEIPYSYIGKTDEDFYRMMQNLTEYYGFHGFDLTDEQSELYETEYWQNGLLISDGENMNRQLLYVLKIGENLRFNMYTRMYDVTDVS